MLKMAIHQMNELRSSGDVAINIEDPTSSTEGGGPATTSLALLQEEEKLSDPKEEPSVTVMPQVAWRNTLELKVSQHNIIFDQHVSGPNSYIMSIGIEK